MLHNELEGEGDCFGHADVEVEGLEHEHLCGEHGGLGCVHRLRLRDVVHEVGDAEGDGCEEAGRRLDAVVAAAELGGDLEAREGDEHEAEDVGGQRRRFSTNAGVPEEHAVHEDVGVRLGDHVEVGAGPVDDAAALPAELRAGEGEDVDDGVARDRSGGSRPDGGLRGCGGGILHGRC